MKSKILVLGDGPIITGFKLAGLEHVIQVDEKNFQTELEKVIQNEEFGIIITNETLMGKIDWKLKKKIDSIAYPVIVPLPDKSGVSNQGDEIRSLIKRALGFDLAK